MEPSISARKAKWELGEAKAMGVSGRGWQRGERLDGKERERVGTGVGRARRRRNWSWGGASESRKRQCNGDFPKCTHARM